MSHMTGQIGRVLGGRYKLISPLGGSASAEVYVADDERLQRQVVVKLLPAALAGDEAFLESFRTEARAAAALSHPNILAVYDWQGEGQPYLITEHAQGGSLQAMLDADRLLSPSQALLVGLQAAQGLAVAHRADVVHGDLRPPTLMFGGDGRVRLADFGLARAVAAASESGPPTTGERTNVYASPEQVQGEPPTPASDVYSLALLLVEAVTGEVPFAADTPIVTLAARLDTPIDVPPELGALQEPLAKAGALSASERPDAVELASLLTQAASELPRPAPLPLVTSGTGTERDKRIIAGTPGALAGVGDGDEPPASDMTVQQAALPVPAPSVAVEPTGGVPQVASPAGGSDHTEVHAGGLPAHRAGRRRRLPGWAVPTLAMLFALAVGAGGFWLLREVTAPSYEVPEALIGSQVGDMNEIIGDYGWRIEQTERYADETEPGEILDTRPEPGTLLKEGDQLEVVVSRGPEPVDLPQDIQGMVEADAVRRLEELGFTVAVGEPVDHESVPEGDVIGYAEGTGDRAPRGSEVELVVSAGPPWPTIPNVEGMDWSEARDELRALGFDADPQRVPNEADRDTVLRTVPEIGERAEPGSTVKVYVSRGSGGLGSLVIVPDVIGSDVDDAEETLEDRGFEVQIEGDGDVVTGQSPGGFFPAQSGDEVTIYTDD